MAALSDQLWPLVVLCDQGWPAEDFLRQLRGLTGRGRFILLVEPPTATRPSFEHKELVESFIEVLSPDLLAVAVVTRTNLAKNVALGYFSSATSDDVFFFRDVEQATEWCRDVLKQELGHKLSRRAISNETGRVWSPPPAPAREDPDASWIVGNELPVLLEGFREPAFLADSAGQLLFQNEEAERSPFGHAWVERAVGGLAHPSSVNARVFPLVDGQRYLVLPIPPWEIPESFARITTVWPPRLRQTMRLILGGFSDQEIADELGTKPSTARTYVERIFERLGVRSRKALLSPTFRWGCCA